MHPRELKQAFVRGENITGLLRLADDSDVNTEDIIETAYDLQTGSYIEAIKHPVYLKHKQQYGDAIAEVLMSLVDKGGSVLEPGVGEGTTLSFVMRSCESHFSQFHGFDLSWSRIAMCRQWLASQACEGVFLAVASLFHAPYADDSFDVVYTSHTIEPNGGQEAAALLELYRVAARYLVLLEPGFELASTEAQRRMRRLGYAQRLKDHAVSLGMKVLRYELFGFSANPLNPTAITVIEKTADKGGKFAPRLACPRYGDPIVVHDDSLYSPGSMRAYPKILGIPCLRINDGVVASRYESFQN